MADGTGALTPGDVTTPWYEDKSFYVVVLTPLCAIAASRLGLNLDPMAIAGIAAVLVSFVVGHKWSNAVKVSAVIRAQTPSALKPASLADAAATLDKPTS